MVNLTIAELRLSVGAIVDAIHRAAQQARPAVDAMLERMRGSPAVNADETVLSGGLCPCMG